MMQIVINKTHISAERIARKQLLVHQMYFLIRHSAITFSLIMIKTRVRVLQLTNEMQ